jgi:actin related protein 2/3 complex subunit 1A/1B
MYGDMTTPAPVEEKPHEPKVVEVISCHAWNKDLSMIAFSPNNEEVHIYKTSGSEDTKKWEKKYVLKEHGGVVSGIDWCPTTNLLATCGQDRNAYVWRYDDKKDQWKPTLVILRINRAATSIKWSPLGNKFAVTSGSKCVPICQYEKESDWWISKMIKKHKSTVLTLAWCCNNKFIVTGCSDFKARVFSAYIEGLDAAEDDGFGEVWSQQHAFGEVLAQFDVTKSWVNSVAWSPNGFRMVFAGHGSSLHFIQILAGSPAIVQTLNLKSLPFLDIRFLTDNTVVAAGFDCTPNIFSVTGGSEADPVWSFTDTCDKEAKDMKATTQSAVVKSTGPPTKSAFSNARDLFKATTQGHTINNQGGSSQSKQPVSKPPVLAFTRHTNAISLVWPNPNDNTKFITSGLDGRVLFWDLNKIGVAVK